MIFGQTGSLNCCVTTSSVKPEVHHRKTVMYDTNNFQVGYYFVSDDILVKESIKPINVEFDTNVEYYDSYNLNAKPDKFVKIQYDSNDISKSKLDQYLKHLESKPHDVFCILIEKYNEYSVTPSMYKIYTMNLRRSWHPNNIDVSYDNYTNITYTIVNIQYASTINKDIFEVVRKILSVDHILLRIGNKIEEQTIMMPFIKSVIFNEPYTIVKWTDGTFTKVRCIDQDSFNEEIGLSMAISRKYFESISHKDEKTPRADFLRYVKHATRSKKSDD